MRDQLFIEREEEEWSLIQGGGEQSVEKSTCGRCIRPLITTKSVEMICCGNA